MPLNIHRSWKKHLKNEFESIYFQKLVKCYKKEYLNSKCYPPQNLIFNAFNQCCFDDIKVVLLGQDPYHSEGQANGLSFSVSEGLPHPPSLINIFKEIENDLGIPYPKNGSLTRWSNQGALLLNSTLTVRENEAGSHQKMGWEVFTDKVIQKLSKEKKHLVFFLWGGYAKRKIKIIDSSKHLILSSGHPSPLSANRGFWFGNKHFSQCNDFLKFNGYKAIGW